MNATAEKSPLKVTVSDPWPLNVDKKNSESRPYLYDMGQGLLLTSNPQGSDALLEPYIVRRSTDAGKTWQPIANFPNLKEQGWRHEMVCLSNGWLLASEILGPGVGGERIRYVLSRDDGVTWGEVFEYYNPGRAIGGRACRRTVELGGGNIGVVFYDVDTKQTGGPGLFFLIPFFETIAVLIDVRIRTTEIRADHITLLGGGGGEGGGSRRPAGRAAEGRTERTFDINDDIIGFFQNGFY